MLLSRILSGLGRFFVSLGVLTLLFVAYQLWGTGILTAQAQNALGNDFEELLAEADDDLPAAAEESAVDANETGAERAAQADGDAADSSSDRAQRRRLARLLWQPNGKPVAQMFAPAIDFEWTVVAGVDSDALAKGPGHYTSTPMPGQPGNASLAGHRTTWGAPFNRIDELDPGDEITVRTIQGTFVYRVVEQDNGKGHFIVTPDRVDVLDQDFTEHPNRLTLTSCHPKFSAAQRIIVVAELVGEPAPFIGPPGDNGQLDSPTLASEDFGSDTTPAGAPADATTDNAGAAIDGDTAADDNAAAGDPDPADPAESDPAANTGAKPAAPTGDVDDPDPALRAAGEDDFGEGLNGDSSAILPSITWGLAAMAIWATTAFAKARWRPIPSYALGVIPFFAVLFVCFSYIDRAIPSY